MNFSYYHFVTIISKYLLELSYISKGFTYCPYIISKCTDSFHTVFWRKHVQLTKYRQHCTKIRATHVGNQIVFEGYKQFQSEVSVICVFMTKTVPK